MFINNVASIVQQGPDNISELSSYKLVDDFQLVERLRMQNFVLNRIIGWFMIRNISFVHIKYMR